MTFSPTDAAFEGFRLTRREPKMIIALALVYAVTSIIFLAVAYYPLGQMMKLMGAMSSGVEPSEAEVLTFMKSYGQLIAISALPSLIINSIVQTAVVRAVINPAANRYGFLRLGKDELRVFATNLLVGLIIGFAALIGFGVVGVLFGFGAQGMPLLIFVGGILMLAVIAGMAWLAIKLCLSVPITFTEKRIGIQRSFAVTKGHFWPLVGMVLLAMVLSIAVSFLGSMVTTPLTMVTGGLSVLAGETGLSAGVISALFVWSIISAVLGAAQMLIVYAPLSAAWQSLKG